MICETMRVIENTVELWFPQHHSLSLKTGLYPLACLAYALALWSWLGSSTVADNKWGVIVPGGLAIRPRLPSTADCPGWHRPRQRLPANNMPCVASQDPSGRNNAKQWR